MKEESKRKISNPYTVLEGYNCFGCDPRNESGLQMEFEEEGEMIVSHWHPRSHFAGYKDVLHGGIQATLMDEMASWAVQTKLGTGGVTAQLDVRYKKPVYVTDRVIRLTGKIVSHNHRIADVETALYDGNGQLCSTGHIRMFLYPEKIAREKLYYPGVDAFFKGSAK
ncbi:MAG: PaaI family thioesterase [Bacteroidales bacterium]